jgi:hypothetical protein
MIILIASSAIMFDVTTTRPPLIHCPKTLIFNTQWDVKQQRRTNRVSDIQNKKRAFASP